MCRKKVQISEKELFLMRLKKILSVFLAAVMLYTAMSVGLTGVAAEIDYNAQYRMLAEALKNEHVRELTNYTVTNKTLDNGTEGFDQEARGFAYLMLSRMEPENRWVS